MAEPHQHRSIESHLHENGPSTSQVLAVVTLFPVGGVLLSLAGLILIGTLFGTAVSAPLFLLFSPIIVPAVTIALAVAGFLTSGVFGITALSSIAWITNYFRKTRWNWPEQFDQAGGAWRTQLVTWGRKCVRRAKRPKMLRGLEGTGLFHWALSP